MVEQGALDEVRDDLGRLLVGERGELHTERVEVPLVDGRRALALPCGNGEYAAYWAVDEGDKPIALVVDFDVFTQKEWKARPPT